MFRRNYNQSKIYPHMHRKKSAYFYNEVRFGFETLVASCK